LGEALAARAHGGKEWYSITSPLRMKSRNNKEEKICDFYHGSESVEVVEAIR